MTKKQKELFDLLKQKGAYINGDQWSGYYLGVICNCRPIIVCQINTRVFNSLVENNYLFSNNFLNGRYTVSEKRERTHCDLNIFIELAENFLKKEPRKAEKRNIPKSIELLNRFRNDW